MSQFESDQSAFNFAYEYLKQIKLSLDYCTQMAIAENMDGWMKWIRAVYRQLAAKLNENETEEFESLFKEVYSLLNDIDKRIDEKPTILSKLDSLEIKIRQRLQKKGMLLPSKEDPKFAILQR